ncbi:LCP family protein [Paractinoplanes globisporus]|uniref:LCP family protein n=1 Tax=Paractinoplanes globisporus TaxID=113565 RepID=A0ABW6WKT8_9ACTN|nr:LCP family protein [Actinoplanes globisporus]
MPRKPRGVRRKSPLWARLSLAAGIVLMLPSGTAITVLTVAEHQVNAALPDQDLLGSAKGTGAKKHADVKGAKNILLASLDTRPSWTKSHEPSRSDSIIILHIPADHTTAYMLSIPRDTLIDIPAFDNGAQKYGGGQNKINSAFAYGSRGLDGDKAIQEGTKLLAQTVTNKFGIQLDGAAIIDFSGFKQVLQVLGKVCMYVDENVTSIHVGKDKNGKFAVPYKTDSAGANARKISGVTPNKYTIGNHCFTPVEALDYARQRDLLSKGDGDYGRQRHQQQLLKAIMKTAASKGLNSPTKLPGLLSAIGKAMVVDGGGVSLEDWVLSMSTIKPDDMITLKTNADSGGFRTVPKDQTPPGVGSSQYLDDESLKMFAAAKNDTLGQFVLTHPTWLAST